MALPNQEHTIVRNKDNWKLVLDIDYEEENSKLIVSKPPMHLWRANSSSQQNARAMSEGINNSNMEAM